jgi:hypothetical protein
MIIPVLQQAKAANWLYWLVLTSEHDKMVAYRASIVAKFSSAPCYRTVRYSATYRTASSAV